MSDARGDPVEDAVATIIGDSLSELLDEMDRHGMERESCVFWIERKRPAQSAPQDVPHAAESE